MKPAARIGLFVAALTVVAVAVLVLKPESEPECEGKPLSYWLDQSFSDYPRRNEKAIHALRRMGEPAIRQLTGMVEREDSVLTTRLLSYRDKVPMINSVVSSKYWYRYLAAKALGDIGPSAASAIPVLEKMSRDSERSLARAAEAALVRVRNESLENYISAYLDYESTNSTKAFGLLMELGPYAREAVPVLLQELESTNSRLRLNSLLVLRTVGIESAECVPVLTNLLSDTNEMIRSSAAMALANCGHLAKPATSAVIAMLDDQEEQCRSSALFFLMRVVPPDEFQPFRPSVQRATNDPSETVRDLARQLLDEKRSTR